MGYEEVSYITNKRFFPSELALLLAVVVNSIAVPLIIKANFGATTNSSVPHVLSAALPKLGLTGISFGMCQFGFQLLCLLFLMVVIRSANPRYALSLVVSVLFSALADVVLLAIAALPDGFAVRTGYYCLGLAMLSLGISLFILCGLPALPFDAVVRDLAAYFGRSVMVVKIAFDVVCVLLTCAVSLLVLGGIYSVGVGTIVATLLTGVLVNFWRRLLRRYFTMQPGSALGRKLSQKLPQKQAET